jgi:hypothetical protein
MHKAVYWIIGILLAHALILYFLGQPPICECGYVKFWEGHVFSQGNSQHIADWYTFSHVIHGLLFYALAKFLFPKAPFAVRLLLAVGIESAWEVTENTPMVINHYRQQALAVGYVGDSVLNSFMDAIWMIVGFFLASRLPVWVSVGLMVAMELLVLYFIRDNLTLNIINLIHPFEFINKWQVK